MKEDYEEEEIFCYIYQTQRKCSWFCDLFFKNHIISIIVHNILIEIGIIGFEKKLNDNLEEREIKENFKTLGTYLGIFLFYVIIEEREFLNYFKIKNFSHFTQLAITFYVFDIVISGFSAFGKNKLKSVTDDWLILIIISYTKYINFMVLEKLINLIYDESVDILSNSFVITSVFFIYDIIIFLITDLADCNSDNLILFQFIIGIIILLFFWML